MLLRPGPESLGARQALRCPRPQPGQEAFWKLGLTKEELLAPHRRRSRASCCGSGNQETPTFFRSQHCHHYLQKGPKGHLSNRE